MNKSMCDFISEHRNDDVRDLALHASRYPDVDIRYASEQISGWQTARTKLPLWAATDGIIFPPRISMEQCSSQQTGEYKADIVSRLLGANVSDECLTMCDLTGGFGVDASLMARRLGARLTFVEQNEHLCSIARNNMPLLGIASADIVCADSTSMLASLPHHNLIYIDPARRDSHGGKVVAISDCTPDLTQILDSLLHLADIVMIKLSPMLDMAAIDRQMHDVAEVHVVSVHGECKELLVVCIKGAVCPMVHCVNLGVQSSHFQFERQQEREAECHYSSEVLEYIYEPNASLMKAGAFKSVARYYGLQKLHPSSHLYTSAELVSDFPGRTFKVDGSSPFSKKPLRQLLSGLKKANLTVRNFPATVADLRKRLSLSEGGDVYLFATTLADNSKVLVRASVPDKTAISLKFPTLLE